MESGTPEMDIGCPEMAIVNPEIAIVSPEMEIVCPEMDIGSPEMETGCCAFTLQAMPNNAMTRVCKQLVTTAPLTLPMLCVTKLHKNQCCS